MDDTKLSSLKESMILTLSSLTKIKVENMDYNPNSLIIVTAAGTIYGTPCFSASEADTTDRLMISAYEQAKDTTISDASKSCLILKDATLVTSPSFKQSFKILFVFPDDIIAITIGDTRDLK